MNGLREGTDTVTEHNDCGLKSYVERCGQAIGELFDAARVKEEVQFAMALTPEFRGEQSPGWCTSEEVYRALEQYLEFLKGIDPSPIKIRIALALYAHLSEASGFYEIPKNMMRIASGHDYNILPFQHLVTTHARRGSIISPNANRVMKDLLGHADELGLEIFKLSLLRHLTQTSGTGLLTQTTSFGTMGSVYEREMVVYPASYRMMTSPQNSTRQFPSSTRSWIAYGRQLGAIRRLR